MSPASIRSFRTRPLVSHLYYVLSGPIARLPPPPGPFELGRPSRPFESLTTHTHHLPLNMVARHWCPTPFFEHIHWPFTFSPRLGFSSATKCHYNPWGASSSVLGPSPHLCAQRHLPLACPCLSIFPLDATTRRRGASLSSPLRARPRLPRPRPRSPTSPSLQMRRHGDDLTRRRHEDATTRTHG